MGHYLDIFCFQLDCWLESACAKRNKMNWFEWILCAIGSLTLVVGFAFLSFIFITVYLGNPVDPDDD